jgi:hypothetical protein
MPDLDSFMSYELTHESGNKKQVPNGGCLSGCFTMVIFALCIFVIIITLILL